VLGLESIGNSLSASEKESYQILVVEDNRINRKVVEKTLNKAGFKCDLASNGLEALEILHHKEYDIIFMDVHMPEMDGMEATREIRSKHGTHNAQIPIIAFTASVLDHEKELCIEAGMNDFIPKPVELHRLIETLSNWVQKVELVS
tara:strand:+ start:32520 stop:32957 length:438 start_codon:yes stop_codon:yes gene_type:complete